MKTFLPFGIAGLIFLISTGVYAQNAQTRPEAVEKSSSKQYHCELATAEGNNALHCHLMMNPAMVEESEEAIEQFILGETRAPLSAAVSNHLEDITIEQVVGSQGFATPPQSL